MPIDIISQDGMASYEKYFFSHEEANTIHSRLLDNINWQEGEIFLFGQLRKIPRLQAWYADEGTTYTYSGTKLTPEPWTPSLIDIKSKVEVACDCKFNSVLLNLYRGGNDSMGWHSDDEPELGVNPTIASLSFGETRRFHLRHKTMKMPSTKIDLNHGSLLVMSGALQHHWQHQLPKTKRKLKARINLTFRQIIR